MRTALIVDYRTGEERRLKSPERAEELAVDGDQMERVRPSAHKSEFDDLIADVNKLRSDLRQRRAEIARDRERCSYFTLTKHLCTNYRYLVDFAADLDFDEYDWETEYQMGPETYLMSTKNARLSARVRDYRRELWGEGAPLAQFGILGVRNNDITIR